MEVVVAFLDSPHFAFGLGLLMILAIALAEQR